MDAYLSSGTDLTYLDEPPVLVAASSEAAMAHAERTVEASGFRIGAKLSIDLARERIQQQPDATALWIELDEDCGGAMDELISQLNDDVAVGRYCAVISATAALLDPLCARIADDAIELVIDAGEAERVSALAIAAAKRKARLRLSDVASDNNAERLRQLSEEVSRIASTLARLSAGPVYHHH